jgi:hypothetical protein
LQAYGVRDREQILDPMLELTIDEGELLVLELQARKRRSEQIGQHENDRRDREEQQGARNIEQHLAVPGRVHPKGPGDG